MAVDFGMFAGKLSKDGGAFSLTGNEENIGLYFSAHWCPPCRGFTPRLAEFYKKATEKGAKLEIIFLSSDRNESEFKQYFDEMPWAALNFEESEVKSALSLKFGVRGIPTLIILDKNGDVISANARSDVENKIGAGDFTCWKK